MEDVNFKLPLSQEDCFNLMQKVYFNQESLNQDVSQKNLQTLESWVGYMSKLSTLIRIFKSLEEDGNSLKDLIDKGYIS